MYDPDSYDDDDRGPPRWLGIGVIFIIIMLIAVISYSLMP